MQHEIVIPDRKGLREFGIVTGVIVAVLFGLFFPWLLERPIPLWPWVITGILALWGTAAPDSLAPVYRYWMKFGLLLSKVTTPLVLGIVFFLVFFPVALVLKLMGRDPMHRALEPDTVSYRKPSQRAARESVERPF
jgi:predicted membrane protein